MENKDKDINWMTYNFKQEIINSINTCGLPGVLVCEVLNGLVLQIRNQIQEEMKQEKVQS